MCFAEGVKKTLFLSLLLSACVEGSVEGETPKPAGRQYSSNGEDDGMVCRMERDTGSNIAEKVCYKRDDKRSVEDQETMRRMQNARPQGAPAGGGR